MKCRFRSNRYYMDEILVLIWVSILAQNADFGHVDRLVEYQVISIMYVVE